MTKQKYRAKYSSARSGGSTGKNKKRTKRTHSKMGGVTVQGVLKKECQRLDGRYSVLKNKAGHQTYRCVTKRSSKTIDIVTKRTH